MSYELKKALEEMAVLLKKMDILLLGEETQELCKHDNIILDDAQYTCKDCGEKFIHIGKNRSLLDHILAYHILYHVIDPNTISARNNVLVSYKNLIKIYANHIVNICTYNVTNQKNIVAFVLPKTKEILYMDKDNIIIKSNYATFYTSIKPTNIIQFDVNIRDIPEDSELLYKYIINII